MKYIHHLLYVFVAAFYSICTHLILSTIIIFLSVYLKALLNTRIAIAISIKTSFVISYILNITVSSHGNRQVQLEFLPKAITNANGFSASFRCLVSRQNDASE